MLAGRDIFDPQESEIAFRQLIEVKDYAIIMLSPEGKVLSWNLGAQHMFGYSTNELLGKDFGICYAPNYRKAQIITSQLAESVTNGRLETEWELAQKDGTVFFANLTYTPLYNSTGKLQGFTAVVRDITVQRQLAEENKLLHEKLEDRVRQRTLELENANKELNAFSYSVSHDLRTPLRAIGGYSKMFLEDYGKNIDDEGRRILNNIVENTELMAKLIDDLLEFSRLSRLEVLNDKINMKAIAERCIADLLLVWREKAYRITVTDLPECHADPNMMKQVWMNLIENALKYSSKMNNPDLKIDYTEDTNSYTYFISDNGVGFDMQYASKLFGVFQRLHTNDEFPGTGLGLALVNRIIAKHGGSVWAKSGINKGTTLYFTIPKKT